jgi:hypothetical protein
LCRFENMNPPRFYDFNTIKRKMTKKYLIK